MLSASLNKTHTSFLGGEDINDGGGGEDGGSGMKANGTRRAS